MQVEHIWLREMIEEAEELADRFPDLPEYDVHEHVQYVTQNRYHVNSLIALRVIGAYYGKVHS